MRIWNTITLAAALTLSLGLMGCGEDPPAGTDAGGGVDAGGGGMDAGTDAGPTDAGVRTITRPAFQNPTEWMPDGNGVYQLTMEPAEVTIGGNRYCLRTFNGAIPGPTLRVPASSSARQIRLDYSNAFTTSDMNMVGTNTRDFNTTNLHTHGLHVQPEQTTDGMFLGDNILHRIGPTESAQYRFDIDEFRTHQEGTFWYHPHIHGVTTIHVANGMAGALIIEGPTDQVSGIDTAPERIFMMQQIPVENATPLAMGESCSESTVSINDFSQALTATVMVNGLETPLITSPPGQVERWRFVHAGPNVDLRLSLRPANDLDCSSYGISVVSLQQIAADGYTYPAKRERPAFVMSPGQRVDVMVEVPQQAGTYCLVAQTTGREQVIAMLDSDPGAGTAMGAMPSDTDLAAIAPPLMDCSGAPDGTQTAIFAQAMDSMGNACPMHNINCRLFDPMNPRVVTAGATDDWIVSSEGEVHPFHIHTNHFTVCEGTEAGVAIQPQWRDTIAVERGATYRLRTAYLDYTGRIVMHCHKLDHEDQGMMELVSIQ